MESDAPATASKIHITHGVALQTELHQAIHCLETVNALDAIAVRTQLPQMVQTFELWDDTPHEYTSRSAE